MKITNVEIITMDGMWPAQAVRNTTFLHNTRPLITADFRHLDMVHCESLTDLSGPL